MPNLLEILFKTSPEKEYCKSIKKLSTNRWNKLVGSKYRKQDFSLFEYLVEEVPKSSFKQFVFLRRIGYFLVITGLLYIALVIAQGIFSNTRPLERLFPWLVVAAGFFCFFLKLTTSEAYLRRREITPKVHKRLSKDLAAVESDIGIFVTRLERLQSPLLVQELRELALERDVVLGGLLTNEQLNKFGSLQRGRWIRDFSTKLRNHEVLASCIRAEIAFLESNA